MTHSIINVKSMDNRFAAFYIALTVFIFLFYSDKLSALMPPHIDSSMPENGGILLGDTVRFFGYSLSYGDLEQLEVIDLSANSEVEIFSDLVCFLEGEGNNPGCVQSKCTLTVALKEIMPTHEYELSFLNSNIGGAYSIFHFFGSAENVGEDNDLDGITAKQGDCNDQDSEIYPGAIELCSDNVDRDCDGDHSVCCESDGNGGGGGCIIDTLRNL
jgi:Putative metal-binding motif